MTYAERIAANPKELVSRRESMRRWRAKNPERWSAIARRMVLKRYGLTPATYAAILEKQGNRCRICRVPFDGTPHIDHDHETGFVRGLLCGPCNGRLGWYEKYVVAISEYLVIDDLHVTLVSRKKE
jgi:hypothetical protein